jgi:hypothetical protein
MRSLSRCGLALHVLVAEDEMYTPREGVDQRERRLSELMAAAERRCAQRFVTGGRAMTTDGFVASPHLAALVARV